MTLKLVHEENLIFFFIRAVRGILATVGTTETPGTPTTEIIREART
jgi:hypothetical protein